MFKITNRPIEEKNIVQCFVTKTLGQFKMIKNGYGYDCIAQQPTFLDIFEDEKVIK